MKVTSSNTGHPALPTYQIMVVGKPIPYEFPAGADENAKVMHAFAALDRHSFLRLIGKLPLAAMNLMAAGVDVPAAERRH